MVTENVTRGALVSALTIPLAIVAFGAVGAFFGLVTGFLAIVVPPVAASLYKRGSGGLLTRAGWAPFITIAMAAVILGVLAGVLGGAYYGFSAVGGDGGVLSPAYWTAVRYRFTGGITDTLFPVVLGLGLGIAALVGILRQPRTVPPAEAPPEAPAAPGVMLNGKPLDPDRS